MEIILAADHAGFRLKEEMADWLRNEGYPLRDIGTNSEDSVDYPAFAKRAARMVAASPDDRAILFCGSGHGMAMAANRVPGARACSARTPSDAARAREDGDINILALGGRVLVEAEAQSIIEAFLETDFSGDARHRRRIEQIDAGEPEI